MCGICGFVGIEQRGLIEQMTAALSHRGPDDEGCFVEGETGLGHRRLSIIDIEGGHQPMETPDGRLVIVFNGEIYNFGELRGDLESRGHRFATRSDTEVLLRLYQADGAGCLESLNGMFALAIYDRQRRELFLARDRVGIKPLYYAEVAGKFLFASETKSLLRYNGLSRTLNATAIHDYLTLRYVPGDLGMFREIKRLPAGHFLRHRDGVSEIRRYWAPPVHDGARPVSEGEALEELSELLERSVRRRLISDVSFGAYLSGGLDSSVIVALMSKLVSAPIKTFSVGFDYEHDELDEAAATAKLLDCEHYVVQCRADDIALLPEVTYHSDEPLGDAISIPMYKLAREAKKQVSVILTGEGADEIFGGYLFHKVMWAAQIYKRVVPAAVNGGIVKPLLGLSPAALLNVAFRYPAYLGSRGKMKVIDYLTILYSGTLDDGYRHLISLFDRRETDHLYTPEFVEELVGEREERPSADDSTSPTFDQLLRLQFRHWLPDNMLLRQDKMSMASAIEGRVPYLDHELIDFAFRLPRELRIRRFTGKYLLRRLARRLLPRETAERRKMPFYFPLERCLDQPAFIDLVEDLLGDRSITRRGIFRPEAVSRLRRSIHRREFLLVKQVFSLMALELWFRIFVDAGGTRSTVASRRASLGAE